MTQLGEGVIPPSPPSTIEPCRDESDHIWKEFESGLSPDNQIDSLDNEISRLEGKPSRTSQKRGYEFEKKAVIDNKEKLPIDKCSKEYICIKCEKKQEVDVVGDNRVAEAKSRKVKGVKNKSDQCKRLKSIPSQLLDANKKPLAKIDGDLEDVQKSKEIYERRGFEVEIVV